MEAVEAGLLGKPTVSNSTSARLPNTSTNLNNSQSTDSVPMARMLSVTSTSTEAVEEEKRILLQQEEQEQQEQQRLEYADEEILPRLLPYSY